MFLGTVAPGTKMMETMMIMTAGTPLLKTKSSQSGTVSCTVKGNLEGTLSR